MGRPANTPEVLWSKVDRRGADECWPWKGTRTKVGYGRTQIGDNNYYAHRVIYSLAYPGVITWNLPALGSMTGFLLHTCDNPPCCNPAHLYVGTHADNMADKKRRGRFPDFSGGKSAKCKLTIEQAREIRRLRKDENISARELANRYAISLPSIKTLLRGNSYRE